MNVLVVVTEFGDYPKGHVIKDAAEIERVRESHPSHVVAADHPEDDAQDHHDA